MRAIATSFCSFLICIASANCFAQTQSVFLDFDSATAGSDHVYTTAERNAIQAAMTADYAGFDFSFTQTAPGAGDFSSVVFNSGPAFGLADAIDFRNLDRNDNCTVDVNSGATTSAEYVTLSANVGSHELGHLSGLRHGDSFGPIGTGIDLGTTAASGYFPTYPGPAGAAETRFNIMESDSTFIEHTFDQSFSERSAVKLAFNESPHTIAEVGGAHGDFSTAQVVTFATIAVPNTRNPGQTFFGMDLGVDAFDVIDASLTSGLEEDWYTFEGVAGDLFNFEVMSGSLDRILDSVDPEIEIWQSDGGGGITDVAYYGNPTTFNDNEFESKDSILIDLVLPTTNTYFIRVTPHPSNPIGSYELFGYRFFATAVPEPGTFGITGFALAMFLGIRRRRS